MRVIFFFVQQIKNSTSEIKSKAVFALYMAFQMYINTVSRIRSLKHKTAPVKRLKRTTKVVFQPDCKVNS